MNKPADKHYHQKICTNYQCKDYVRGKNVLQGVEFGGGGGVAGECVDDKFQVLAWAPDRGLHITSSSSSSPFSDFGKL